MFVKCWFRLDSPKDIAIANVLIINITIIIGQIFLDVLDKLR